MREVRTRLTPELLAVVDAMRGGQPRTQFLADVIHKGVKAIHAEASKNSEGVEEGWILGLAPLKVEGEYTYFDPSSVERIGALIKKLY